MLFLAPIPLYETLRRVSRSRSEVPLDLDFLNFSTVSVLYYSTGILRAFWNSFPCGLNFLNLA